MLSLRFACANDLQAGAGRQRLGGEVWEGGKKEKEKKGEPVIPFRHPNKSGLLLIQQFSPSVRNGASHGSQITTAHHRSSAIGNFLHQQHHALKTAGKLPRLPRVGSSWQVDTSRGLHSVYTFPEPFGGQKDTQKERAAEDMPQVDRLRRTWTSLWSRGVAAAQSTVSSRQVGRSQYRCYIVASYSYKWVHWMLRQYVCAI